MKNYSKLLAVALFAIFSASCSTDSTDVVNDAPQNSALRTTATTYPEFGNLFKSLYGSAYYISDSSIAATSRGVDYKITEVYDASRRTVLGYFEDSQDGVFYYKHDAAQKTITEYAYRAGAYLSHVQDLSGDPVYGSVGINPIRVQPASQHPGFGWGDPHLSDDCVNGRRYWVQDKYFAFVRVNTRPVMNLANTEQLWAPCE